MAIIEKLIVDEKRKKEYVCILDNGVQFGLHEDILVSKGLHKGKELLEEDIRYLSRESELRKIYHHALSYLSYRMRSKSEMEAFLLKKEYTPRVVKEVIARLIDEKMLDDVAFAQAFVRTKVNTTSSGPGKIKQDLIKKGVAEPIAEAALTHYSKAETLEMAQKIINKKLRQSRSHTSLNDRMNKTKQHLLQKGFSFDIIEEAIQLTDTTKNPDEEWQALCYHAEKAMRKYGDLEAYKYKQKMKSFLYRKGFKIEDIDRYLREQETDF